MFFSLPEFSDIALFACRTHSYIFLFDERKGGGAVGKRG